MTKIDVSGPGQAELVPNGTAERLVQEFQAARVQEWVEKEARWWEWKLAAEAKATAAAEVEGSGGQAGRGQ